MTEHQWQTCTDPAELLDFLRASGKVSDRKLRLCGCAVYRRLWHLLRAPSRDAIEAGEQFADGLLSQEELDAAQWSSTGPDLNMEWAAAFESPENAPEHQADIVRDLFGNPFRAPPVIDPAWLTPAVRELVQQVYDQRSFERLPELAAALQAAGCRDAQVLEHLRGPGPDVRGCWVLDLVLGKH